MSFGAPLFLLAAVAGLIPVLVHLIHRQKAKEVRFSTLRFLRQSVQRTRRRKYIEDMSLLAIRVIVMLLIALGLARPALSSLAALWGRGQTAAIAIVLDNSASMALTDDGRPRFDTARQAVGEVLARLRPGDEIALLPTGGPPGPELGRLFRAHETVRQALEQCRPSLERADLASKIEQARDLLSRSDAPSREVYFFTDNQSLSWDGLKAPEETDDPGKAKQSSEVPLVLVNVNREPAPNVSLQTLSLSSPAPVAGARFQAEVEVQSGSTVAQQRHLELQIDGLRVAVSPTLNLPPGGSVKHLFQFVLDREGVHRGEVRLVEDDGSAQDNQLYFAVTVDQQIPVAIVKPRLDEVPQVDEAFYLERALAPSGSVGGAFRMTTLTPESLVTTDLAGQAVVFCVNLPSLVPGAAEKLAAYARSGGHIVWVCGANVQPVAYNAMNALAQGQLLPAPLQEQRQPLPGGAESWHVGFLDKDHPALAPLTEPASLYQSVLVSKHFPMSPGQQADVRVLVKLEDGQPLLAEKTVGAGSVLLLGTGLHIDWTNLPLKPIFLPMLARLTFHLAGAESERTMSLAGAPVSLPIRKGKSADQASATEIEIVRPSGEIVRPDPRKLAESGFRYSDTHEAGIYVVRFVNRQGSLPSAFAVNIDPAESDPATITRQELQARFGRRPLLFCEDPASIAETIQRLREGTGLWQWFLVAVLVGLVLEVFLANRGAGARIQASPAAAPPVRPAQPSPHEGVPVSADDVRGFLESLQQEASDSSRRE
jgi:hypothetical protein